MKFIASAKLLGILLFVGLLLKPHFSGATGILQGYVRNQSGAGVHWSRVSADNGLKVFSDTDGFFTIGLDAGTYSITASASCYEEQTVSPVTIVDGEITNQDFTLQALLCLESVYPSLGEMGSNLDVALKGSAFGAQTRISMIPDSGNRMHIIGALDTPGTASSVVVQDNFVYVGDVDAFQIIDVTDPTKLSITGSVATPDWARGIAVKGSYAYVADGSSGLQVIDISNPENPSITGSVDTPGYAWSVAVEGATAYVGDYNGGLQVIDVSNPGNPFIKGSASTPYPALGLAVKEGMAYVACGINVNGGLQVIDISNPAHPTKKGFVQSPGYARDIAISGNIAYLTDFIGGLQVIDISNPLNPVILGSLDTPSYAEGVTVKNEYAYVADYFTGLLIIDAADTANPSIIGRIESPGQVLDVALAGDYAYVADEAGLKIMDVSDPSLSDVIGTAMTPREAYSLFFDGTNAFVADVNGVEIIDVSDPAHPFILSSVVTPGDAYDVAVMNGNAFVADGRKGLQIIDVSSPSVPAIYEQKIFLPGTLNVVTASGDRVYIADVDDNALYIVDVADVENPSLLSTLMVPGKINDMAVMDNRLYLGTDQAGFRIYDLGDPANPVLVSATAVPGDATGVFVVSDTAYVSTSKGSLEIIDISTPASPVVLGSFDTYSYAWNLTVENNTAYVAESRAGVHAIDVSDPANPVLIGTVDTPGDAKSVAVDGNMVYVADWHAGFTSVPVPVELSPLSVSGNDTITTILPSPPVAGHYNLRAFDGSEEHVLNGAVTFTDEINLLTSKAIIVAGGGPDAGLEIWEETKAYANAAYTNLLYQGYRHDDIYYITAEVTAPGRDADATSASDIENAITWAMSHPDTSDLLIYLADHGEQDSFLVRGGTLPEYLTAEQLDTWLDNFQTLRNGRVVLIYDGCKSGTFIGKILPPAGMQRVTITSSAPEEVAYYLSDSHSFSAHFWSTFSGKSGNKANLLEAFERAYTTMRPYQEAQVDANGNGVANEPEDFSTLNSIEGTIYSLRRQYNQSDRSKPVIATVTEDKTLIGTKKATLTAGNIYDVDGDEIIRVWSEIVPPYFNPDADGLTVTNLPTVELTDPDGDGLYEGDSSDFSVFFNTYGTYIVSYFAEDSDGIHSLPITSLVMQTLADEYELDNTHQDARVINLNDPLPQNHSFHDSLDEDWVKFYGLPGETYKIKASNPSVICDPVIELYDVDGHTLLDYVNSSGAGYEEYLNWTCPAEGIYFVRVKNKTSHYGANVSYELKVFNPIAFSLPGYVKGSVTSGGSGVGGVLLKAGGGSAISQSNGAYLIALESGSYTVSASKTGYQSTSFGVSVSSGKTSTKNVSLVATLNHPPVISGTPPGSVKTYESYSFTPTASDPDNNLLIFSVEGLPGWASFNASNGTVYGVPEDQDEGSYGPVTLYASDSKSLVALSPFTINVLPGTNLPPEISGESPERIGADRMYSFTPVASDPNDDLLTFSIQGKPVWAQFNSVNGKLYGIPGDENIGIHGPVTITVKDPLGAGAILTPFTLEVVHGTEIDRYGSLPAVYILLDD